jgi:hypothetical protein
MFEDLGGQEEHCSNRRLKKNVVEAPVRAIIDVVSLESD